MPSAFPWPLTIPICLLSFSLVGCGGSSNVPKYQPVYGNVTLDGEPLANALVSFRPDRAPASAAITDDEGNYVLLNRDGGKGAVEGQHSVSISTDVNGEQKPGSERVPPRYNTETTLSAMVEKGDNEKDFALKTKD